MNEDMNAAVHSPQMKAPLERTRAREMSMI
jgi:hypothetical protein